MANIIVEEKIEGIALESARNLNGNKILEDEIKSRIRSIINEEEIKTNNEEINDLASTISKNLGIENNSETKIEAKKIWIELDKWKNEKVKEVEDFKKEEFKNKFVEETKKLNPDLKEEQLENVKKYAEEISEVFSKNNEIDGCKNEILEANNKFSPGQLQNSFNDLKGTFEFLKKSPQEIKEKIETVKSIKEKIKDIKLPNLKELRSFENITAAFGRNGGVDDVFSKIQKKLVLVDKIDNLTGGLIRKTTVEFGQKIITKIGNQAVQEFASNSLGVLAKEGFQKGFQTVLKGILSGGVKAAGSAGATAVAGGATAAGAGATGAVAATGIGLPIAAIMAAGLFLKKQFGKIAEKLGISIKGFLEENFGKVGGKIIGGMGLAVVALPAVLIAALSAIMVIIGPILLAVFGGMFIYQMFQGNLISSLVPPKDKYSIEKTDYSNESGGVVFSNYSGTVGNYINPKNGITLYVFEKGSRGGRLTQRYDLGTVENSSLEKIKGIYLDKRASVAYEAMVEKARKEGVFSPELNLISGYRDRATQNRLWKEALVKYGSAEVAGIWASNPAKGLSSHATGRTIDIVVCGGSKACGGVENQKNSNTSEWLKNNAADFGFYNYEVEPWHWEYNPVDLTLESDTSL